MAKNLIGLYKENTYEQILKTIFDSMLIFLLDPNMCGAFTLVTPSGVTFQLVSTATTFASSKPFELNLNIWGKEYLGLAKCTRWPFHDLVALISKNLLVCTIQWETLIQSLQNVAL